MPSVSLTFPAQTRAVSEARRALLATLAGWDTGQYDFGAALVLTELATNAALHARTVFQVHLRLEVDHLVVEVADGSTRSPRVPDYGLDAATGRGMALVDALSRTWGVRPVAGGKVVWAHVLPDQPPDLDLDREIDLERDRDTGPATSGGRAP